MVQSLLSLIFDLGLTHVAYILTSNMSTPVMKRDSDIVDKIIKI